MKFSRAVFELRKSLNMSQAAFAKELGVSYTSINRWENDAQQPSPLAIKMLLAFCRERGLVFGYLEEYRK
jgi:putative transcriptional regulator